MCCGSLHDALVLCIWQLIKRYSKKHMNSEPVSPLPSNHTQRGICNKTNYNSISTQFAQLWANIPYDGLLFTLIILLLSRKSGIKHPRLPFAGVINYTSKPFVQFFLMLKTRMTFSILASNKITILFSIFDL